METPIFENYEGFLREHADDISTPKGAAKMIQDEGMFRAYMDTLTDGMDDNIRETVIAVADRNRECLIEESANVPAGSFGSGLI